MFARLIPLVALVLASCAITQPSPPALKRWASAEEHRAACDGKDGWSDPAPPIQILGNVFDVGTCGITVLLVTGEAGHVLIDGGPKEAAPIVAANVKRLGYRLSDIEWILSSHEHFDHVGALAELQRLTGAKVAARGPAAEVLTSGKPSPDDPQRGRLPEFEPVRVDRIMADGDVLTVGLMRFTAHATPGHSPGSTTWTFLAVWLPMAFDVVYADSVTAISDEQYRFTAHPAYVEQFRRSLDRIAGLQCDVLITPHPSASRLFERRYDGSGQTLVDPRGCATYAAAGREKLAARLANEAKP